MPELSPLETEVKDSARSIGRDIGVPGGPSRASSLPRSGLVVRIEGEVTAENLKMRARSVASISKSCGSQTCTKQSGRRARHSRARSIRSQKGDDAGQGHVVALWAVWSVNGFTARFAQLPYEFLDKVSRRITNEVREVGAVVYRISDKPPPLSNGVDAILQHS